MLIPKGNIVHENLSTAFTHSDQLIDGLRKNQFSGYCHVSFWEYDGVLFFDAGKLLNAREETGMQVVKVHTGDVAISNVLTKAQEKDGEISVYRLPSEIVCLLVACLKTTPKYEELSTDLTSLDRVIGLIRRGGLSGYIEVLLEHEAGIGNLFFVEGELIESLLAPPDNQMIADHISVKDINAFCQQHGATFNVYQASAIVTSTTPDISATTTIPQRAITLFETILVSLESVANDTLKEKNFQTLFKMILPRAADKYTFLDPFIGDFRYANGTLSYNGDVTYAEFVNGLCEVINMSIVSLLTRIPKNMLLPKISTALEPVSITYSDLIEQLNLEIYLPEIFRDYSFLQDEALDDKTGKKGPKTRNVLNLQGIGISEIGTERILREFYRVISLMTEKYVQTGTNILQYSRLKKSREFQQYQTATALLQKLDLSYLKDRSVRLAFWINLYNFLVIDGILEFGVSKSIQDVKGFFSKISYRLEEYLFTPDDIEHGILRNNRRRPYSLSRQFTGSDPRRIFSLTPPDNRVHCCFCCAAKSSPPFAVYTPENLDQQLDLAVTRYLLSSGMRVDRDKNELWLNRMFYWYRKDFDVDGKSLPDFIITALQGREIGQFIQKNRTTLTLRFMDYDWSLNGK